MHGVPGCDFDRNAAGAGARHSACCRCNGRLGCRGGNTPGNTRRNTPGNTRRNTRRILRSNTRGESARIVCRER